MVVTGRRCSFLVVFFFKLLSFYTVLCTLGCIKRGFNLIIRVAYFPALGLTSHLKLLEVVFVSASVYNYFAITVINKNNRKLAILFKIMNNEGKFVVGNKELA